MRKARWLLLVPVLLAVLLGVRACGPGGDGVLARLTLEDGSERDSIQVFRGKKLRAELFREKGTFALYEEPGRELAAPQEFQDPPSF